MTERRRASVRVRFRSMPLPRDFSSENSPRHLHASQITRRALRLFYFDSGLGFYGVVSSVYGPGYATVVISSLWVTRQEEVNRRWVSSRVFPKWRNYSSGALRFRFSFRRAKRGTKREKRRRATENCGNCESSGPDWDPSRHLSGRTFRSKASLSAARKIRRRRHLYTAKRRTRAIDVK